eukprot:759506-Hanusia_phi.AAC.1
MPGTLHSHSETQTQRGLPSFIIKSNQGRNSSRLKSSSGLPMTLIMSQCFAITKYTESAGAGPAGTAAWSAIIHWSVDQDVSAMAGGAARGREQEAGGRGT